MLAIKCKTALRLRLWLQDQIFFSVFFLEAGGFDVFFFFSLLMFFSGFFVEAGAFDGASESTSLHFEIAHQWSGLLIEPVSRLRLVMIRLRRWYITIPSSDQWCTTIENHRYQWLSYPKTIGKPLIPMVALNHSIQW